MGKTTKIDWCDSTWNPVTGCKYGCKYCYARRIAERFGGYDGYENEEDSERNEKQNPNEIYSLTAPAYRHAADGKIEKAVYPFGFSPTFHRYRLDEPHRWTSPRNIFVCSMADLFGPWVPDERIRQVIDACCAASQHNYLFLTKNPKRYEIVSQYLLHKISADRGNHSPMKLPVMMFGATAANNEQLRKAYFSYAEWLSIEPILEPIDTDTVFEDERPISLGFSKFRRWKWVVIGAETGNRADKIVPKKEWIMAIADKCAEVGTPVFMKESLREIVGSDFRQKFPLEA